MAVAKEEKLEAQGVAKVHGPCCRNAGQLVGDLQSLSGIIRADLFTLPVDAAFEGNQSEMSH